MQDLNGEKRRTERCSEDRRHARRGPGNEKNPPLAVGHPKVLANHGTDGSPHLHGRPLATA